MPDSNFAFSGLQQGFEPEPGCGLDKRQHYPAASATGHANAYAS
ncbi:hypothetical protein [Kosakonia arachidis]|nr:hypothetical protein [Kosakonia arachidis]